MGDPDFLPWGATDIVVCGFHYGKPHELRQRQQVRQEIRGKPHDRSLPSDQKSPPLSAPPFPI